MLLQVLCLFRQLRSNMYQLCTFWLPFPTWKPSITLTSTPLDGAHNIGPVSLLTNKALYNILHLLIYVIIHGTKYRMHGWVNTLDRITLRRRFTATFTAVGTATSSLRLFETRSAMPRTVANRTSDLPELSSN